MKKLLSSNIVIMVIALLLCATVITIACTNAVGFDVFIGRVLRLIRNCAILTVDIYETVILQ